MKHIIIPGKELENLKDYNEVSLEEGDFKDRSAIDMKIARTLGTELLRHYPRRDWTITVDIDAGVVSVQCMDVSTYKGMVLSLKRSLGELTRAMKGVGGEILERGGLSRGRIIDPGEIEGAERDFRDEIVTPDTVAPEERKALGGVVPRRKVYGH